MPAHWRSPSTTGGEEVALLADPGAAGGHRGVFGQPLDEAGHLGELVGVVQRSERHVLVRQAGPGGLGPLGERGHEVLGHRVGDQHPEHQHRRRAAQLQVDPLDAGGRRAGRGP
jgi:hypothetical protein